MGKVWKELNLRLRLPPHPNIVPFHGVVLNEIDASCVFGFASVYIPGGPLDEKHPARVFKLGGLRQLTQTVDDLNLRFGVSHQDIAPRNLVVDEAADRIMLFDFNYAARIHHALPSPDRYNNGEHYDPDRNDVKGVVFTAYEIITRNSRVRSVPRAQQSLDRLYTEEWVKHPDVTLDHPVEAYRRLVQGWQEKRAQDDANAAARKDNDCPPTNAGPETNMDWPLRPLPPKEEHTMMDMQGGKVTVLWDKWSERRQDVLKRGEKVLNWERPPHSVLESGTRLLATGQVITCGENHNQAHTAPIET